MEHILLDIPEIYIELRTTIDDIERMLKLKIDQFPHQDIDIYLNTTMTDMVEYSKIGSVTPLRYIADSELYNVRMSSDNIIYENITSLKEVAALLIT